MSQEIEKIEGIGNIEKAKYDYIKEKFEGFTSIAQEWHEKANAIIVTEATQKELMLEAKEGRLLLKTKRIEIEKLRKSLKEQSLNEGRMIDSVAKYLTSLIEPAEKHLEQQEKFIEIQEQNQRIKLKEERTILLQPYIDVIDPSSIQLDLITDEAFNTIFNGAKYALENKKAEALRIEEERKEIARKQALFQERSLQIAEYRQFYFTTTDFVLTTETSDIAFEELMKNLVLRKQDYLIEQERIAEENKKLKKQAQKQKEEIKELKTIAKSNTTHTNVTSTIIDREVADKDSFGHDSVEELVTIKKTDYEILKKRYSIAKTTLETVLNFIVPINLRTLVYNTLEELNQIKK
jgi:hypothetical protein